MAVSAPSHQPSANWRMGLPFVVAAASAVLYAIAFPPFNQAWAVLVFLAPFTAWALHQPRWKTYLLSSFAAGWGAWLITLIWLRHIYPPWGWVGVILLAGYLALYWLAWLAALRWVAPRLDEMARWQRIFSLIALAAWWVVLDWVRGWLFSGFPWLPLAAAFWKFPIVLQPLAWTGAWSITFTIVLFNLGLVCGTNREPDPDGEPPAPRRIIWPARLGWELLTPMVLFIGAFFLASVLMHNPQRREVPLLRVGFVQPETPADLKWDDATRQQNWDSLNKLTQQFAYRVGSKDNADLDLILWPEAAPPFSLEAPGERPAPARAAIQKVVDTTNRPLLLGAVVDAPAGPNGAPRFMDSVLLDEPSKGFSQLYYSKRHLVPFGEYDPLPNWFPNLKVVQMMGDTMPGPGPVTIPLKLVDQRLVITGPLVCYEDIFPNLARDEARAGAHLLVVVTNDAWFGKGGGSLQHAAHSVLRAIETRRPVLRCGNDGWSGFIDQDGSAFELDKTNQLLPISADWVLRAQGSTYFRGTGALMVYSNPQFDEQQTFYVRHGDWFIALCALLATAGFALCFLRRSGNPQ